MGMDVYGRNPANKDGEYFRANIWWWRPLWDYCYVVTDIIDENLFSQGHHNDGHGLNSVDAQALATKLTEEIKNGGTAKYQSEYEVRLAAMPDENCRICKGTGRRNGEKSCNGCDSKGKVRPNAALYPFSASTVQDFCRFLMTCGGFKIY